MAKTFMDRLRERLHTLPGSIKKVREDYISSRWLLTKAREYKKALLATIPFVFVPLYLLGYFTRFHLYVGSVIETGKNLFNFSGKEGREAYLLWSITVAALIIVVEAFGFFLLLQKSFKRHEANLDLVKPTGRSSSRAAPILPTPSLGCS